MLIVPVNSETTAPKAFPVESPIKARVEPVEEMDPVAFRNWPVPPMMLPDTLNTARFVAGSKQSVPVVSWKKKRSPFSTRATALAASKVC